MKTYATLSLALLLGAAGTAAIAQDAAPKQATPPAADAAAAQGSANGAGNAAGSPAEAVPATSPQASDQAKSEVPDATAKAVDALGNAPGQQATDTSTSAAPRERAMPMLLPRPTRRAKIRRTSTTSRQASLAIEGAG